MPNYSSNIPGPHDIGDPRSYGDYLLYFFDQTASEGQYYSTGSILGYQKNSSTSFSIFIRGARDVNAVDIVKIVHTAALDYRQSVESIINAITNREVHPTTDKIIRIIDDNTVNNLSPFFTSCTITYGTCCSGANNVTVKDEGVTLTNDAESIDFKGKGVIATASGNDVSVTIEGDKQILSANLIYPSWNLTRGNLWPITGYTAADYNPTAVPFSRFGTLQPSAFQVVNKAYTKLSFFAMITSNLTALAISKLTQSGAATFVAKLTLVRYTPTDGHTQMAFSEEEIAPIDFNAAANKLEKSSGSAILSSPLTPGEFVGITIKPTATGTLVNGNLTDIEFQCTAILLED